MTELQEPTMSDNCVLVTGGAGYIGSQTCKALAQAGFMPVVYDNLSRGHRDAVRWGPLVEGDLRDSNKLVETLRSYRASSVIHFAAFAYVGESMSDPGLFMTTMSPVRCHCFVQPVKLRSTPSFFRPPVPSMDILGWCPSAKPHHSNR
jgi:NAD dependent epimerase/dehydratase family